MLKKSIIFVLIILITLSPVYSISLFPKQQANIYSTFKIDKVLYDKQYTAQIYVASITSKVIDGFQITVKYEKSIDTINIYNQLDPYSTKQYTFKVNQLNPKSLEIRSITNNNHKLVFSSPITYTFNGNEQQIQEQQPSITTIQQPTIPQQLVNEPDYISYTSIRKLDNEKNIIYFTKDHISSNRITTKNNGDIEYQANYQPYGNIYTQTGQEKFKFSGKELDSSNLYYFGARYYNSNTGRFTQVDPIFKPTESPYQYANNNPIKYVDPTGKQFSMDLYPSSPDPVNHYQPYGIFKTAEIEYFNDKLKPLLLKFLDRKTVNKLSKMIPGGELLISHSEEITAKGKKWGGRYSSTGLGVVSTYPSDLIGNLIGHLEVFDPPTNSEGNSVPSEQRGRRFLGHEKGPLIVVAGINDDLAVAATLVHEYQHHKNYLTGISNPIEDEYIAYIRESEFYSTHGIEEIDMPELTNTARIFGIEAFYDKAKPKYEWDQKWGNSINELTKKYPPQQGREALWFGRA